MSKATDRTGAKGDYDPPRYLFRKNESTKSWADHWIVERVWPNGDSEYLCACATGNDAALIAQALQKGEP